MGLARSVPISVHHTRPCHRRATLLPLLDQHCVLYFIFFPAGDLFRDIEKEWNEYASGRNKSEGPKSLWEELADIGEEFVEFLEMVRRMH